MAIALRPLSKRCCSAWAHFALGLDFAGHNLQLDIGSGADRALPCLALLWPCAGPWWTPTSRCRSLALCRPCSGFWIWPCAGLASLRFRSGPGQATLHSGPEQALTLCIAVLGLVLASCCSTWTSSGVVATACLVIDYPAYYLVYIPFTA